MGSPTIPPIQLLQVPPFLDLFLYGVVAGGRPAQGHAGTEVRVETYQFKDNPKP